MGGKVPYTRQMMHVSHFTSGRPHASHPQAAPHNPLLPRRLQPIHPRMYLAYTHLLMKSWILALSMAVMATAFSPADVQAKRLGGGGYSGMQRQLPPRSTPDASPSPAPAKPAQATPTTSPAGVTPAAPAPRRSWMGPLAGLAAGLGLAALASHFGMGAEFGNLLLVMLLGLLGFAAIRFMMGRMASPATQPAMPGHTGLRFANEAPMGSGGGNDVQASTAAAAPPSAPSGARFARPTLLPSGFDQAEFERIAKLTFIRMQAANDTADLADLRQFTTPEMYAAIKLDLQDRVDREQRTDVVRVDAEVIDVVEEATRQVVSVRYHGTIREEADGPVIAFDEVWHLVKPREGGQWAIAGIQQTQ